MKPQPSYTVVVSLETSFGDPAQKRKTNRTEIISTTDLDLACLVLSKMADDKLIAEARTERTQAREPPNDAADEDDSSPAHRS